MLAHEAGRPVDTAVQYLGCLWEFQGANALLEVLITISEDLAATIAEEQGLPRHNREEGPRLRLRQGAIDAWHLAEHGTCAVRVN